MPPDVISFLEILAVVLFGPPVMACLWWLHSRSWARVVQGGKVSQATKDRQKREFKVVLIVMYVMVFSIALYAWLK